MTKAFADVMILQTVKGILELSKAPKAVIRGRQRMCQNVSEAAGRPFLSYVQAFVLLGVSSIRRPRRRQPNEELK